MGTISAKVLGKKTLHGLVWSALAIAAATGCNNDSGDSEDSGGDPGVGGASSGGSGGAAVSGGANSGGSGGGVTGGAATSGGTASGGGASGGAASGGGPIIAGGAPNGGTPSVGGDLTGGMGGDEMGGQGGEGGAPPEEECGGCAKLFVPFTAANTAQFFYLGFASPVDFSDTVVTVRLKGESTSSDMHVQVMVNNGAPNYTSAQPGWVSLSGLTEFGNVTFDVSTVPAPVLPTDFDPAQVVLLNIQVVAGASATAGDTTVWVDSITFSDGATPNYDFATSAQGFAASDYNAIPGSTVSYEP